MLDVTLGAWLATVGAIVVLLVIDLGLSAWRPHAVGFREAVGWSVFYVAVAVAFGVVFGLLAGWDFGAQYFAGYLVEKSLSVDNLFVFLIIMTTFAVPEEHRQRVLIIGIVAALVMRGIFIALGAALLSAFSFMFLVFGLVLLVTAGQLFRHRDEDPSVEDNAVVGAARRVLPLTDRYDDGRLVTRVDGRRVLTPLFLVLLAIGTTDVMFALDSIPAVFGVTEEPYIVFTANAFALLGLRALFFLVSGLLDRLVYLSTGLSLVLAFIGTKLGREVGFADVDPGEHGWLDHDALKVASELSPGDEFRYTFDLGDDWRHRCRVLPEKADPRQEWGPGPLPRRPVAIWGWGWMPDQYGRVTLD